MATLAELSGRIPTTVDPEASTLTGNHYLCFPRIARADASIHGINVLHRGLNGLLEWSAERQPVPDATPLLAVRLEVAGRRAGATPLEWRTLDRWIPWFRTRTGPIRLTGSLCAPGGMEPLARGAVLALELLNESAAEQSCDLALDGLWRWTLLSMLTPRSLRGENRLLRAPSFDAVVLEAGEGGTGAALAICSDWHDGRAIVAGQLDIAAAIGAAEPAPLRPGEEIAVPNGTPLRFWMQRRVRLAPGQRLTASFYIGVAPERDGAVATAAAVRRVGADALLHHGRLELVRIGRRVEDAPLGTLLNRNLLFNYYCAIARAVDDDLIYPVLSRSLLHGATAVVGERAALLWSLPALLLADRAAAREALLRAVEQYSARAGEQWKYLDGAVLAPGVQLDQLCAYGLALDRYVTATDDDTVLDEPLVQEVLREIDESLYVLMHRDVFLCADELLPSGESADHDYATYGNVLVWAFARLLPRVWRPAPDEPPPRLAAAANEIAAAIWQRCTGLVDGVLVLGYSSDLHGRLAVYDDPEGSLALLPFLGFCDGDDPIWTDTMDLLRSSRYPLWLHGRAVPGLARRSEPALPRLAALCADLLGPRREQAIEVLRSLKLPDGLAADAYDADTGSSAAGPHAPALAGLLAWTLDAALRELRAVAASNGGRR